ncbi:MAG: hypothetical protein ABIA76_03040 [Candidatus Diapherotrites archaeon]
MPSRNLCLQCKGRGFCGQKCVILERHQQKHKLIDSFKGTDFNAFTPPGVFIGWNNYPNISFSALSSQENERELQFYDKEEKWFGLPQEKIISMRQNLLASAKNFSVSQAQNPSRDLGILQEIALSDNSTEIELKLKSKPRTFLDFNALTSPVSSFALAEKIILTENPRIPAKAEYLSSDTDVKSVTAVMELLDSGLDLSHIQKIFSSGLLGEKKKRKIVPTRWSITALDSNISEKLINEKILFYSEINSFQVFESNYLDNHILILLVPDSWKFEVNELWAGGSVWSPDEAQAINDFEFSRGRKSYASNVGGAYYAARLPITQYLENKKRQSAAIVFRKISEGYDVPLGVWVIRETVKNALSKRALEFYELDLALRFIKNRLGETEFNELKSKSVLLKEIGKQKKLFEFA